MSVLIAEELVLLALNPDGSLARGRGPQAAVVVAVTGALVSELVLDGHLDLTDGRIHRTGTVPTDPLLAQALDNMGPIDGQRLKHRVDRIRHAGWNEVVDGLVDKGVIDRKKAALRPTSHPVLDVATHAEVVAAARQAALGDEPLDPRSAVLLAMAGPARLLEVLAPDKADHPKAKGRIAEASAMVPAAAAIEAAANGALSAG